MLCIVCNFDNQGPDVVILKYINSEFPKVKIFDRLRIIICSECGFGFLESEPSAHDINYFYLYNYREVGSPYYLNFTNIKSLKSLDARSISQIYLGQSQTIFEKDDIFLDLGPGSGNSFATAQLILNKPKCYGIELNQGAQDFYAKTYSVKTFQYLSQFIGEGLKAKLIVLSHSLEHFRKADVIPFFAELRQSLAINGVAVIEVPNDDLRNFSELRCTDAPHLLFFNRLSLTKLLQSNNFEILGFIEVGAYKNIDSPQTPFVDNRNITSLFKNISNSKISEFTMRLSIYFARKFFRSLEISSKLEHKQFLDQFTSGDNRDCLRVVVKVRT